MPTFTWIPLTNTMHFLGSPPFYDGIMLPKIPHIRTAMFHVNPKETLSVLKPNERVRGLIIFYSKQPTTNAKAFLQTILEGYAQASPWYLFFY